MSTVFQPIVSLRERNVKGLEALSRFPDGSRPDRWFARGWSVGLGKELELASIRSALSHLDQVPAASWLSINLAPEVVSLPELETVIAGVPADRVVIEITEHAKVDDYIQLSDALSRLRRLGCRVAVDDVGAGFASFSHILSLHPDIIKLDAALTRAIDRDLERQALAVALVSFADEIGMELLAEGVETAGEAETLLGIGCSLAQGYYFSEPYSPPFSDGARGAEVSPLVGQSSP